MQVFFEGTRYNVTDIFTGDIKRILNILFSILYEFSWPILFFVGAMLMRKKKAEICVKSGKKLGSVELFIYFCR